MVSPLLATRPYFLTIRHSCASLRPWHTTHTDVGSAENAWSSFLPTHTDVGSAENASSSFQPTILTIRRSCASLHPRHTVHPVHKKGRPKAA